MSDPVDALILDLLEWIGSKPKPYREVIEAWRTSCPRLPVWEEANARGFIEQQYHEGVGAVVSVSPAGRECLARHRQLASSHTRREQVRNR
jgi:D-3-phosphoglycerate dehydrogenase / 2-oxoglutarate reductase